MGHYQHIFLSFSCLNNEIMHVKKSAIFLRKVLYFDQMCYKSAIINPKSAIKALYFMGTSAINYSTFAIFFFGRVRTLSH